MNPLQFNIYLGIMTLIGYVITPAELIAFLPAWLIALFLLFLYVGDFWAFIYRVKITRAANLYELSNGDPSKKVGEIAEPGCVMFYAFLMRFVFRFAIILFSIMLFTGNVEGDAPGWAIGIFIVVVLFELFNMMYTLYELHVFRFKYDDDDPGKAEVAYWENEKTWRSKIFVKLQDPKKELKTLVASFILVISGTAATALFWDGANAEFVGFIQRSVNEGESAVFVILFVVAACFILCLFFLLPVRLAFWLEQLMNADTKQEKFKYRLSVLFAGISITGPILLQLIKSYILGF